jgi:hypothetical protein
VQVWLTDFSFCSYRSCRYPRRLIKLWALWAVPASDHRWAYKTGKLASDCPDWG